MCHIIQKTIIKNIIFKYGSIYKIIKFKFYFRSVVNIKVIYMIISMQQVELRQHTSSLSYYISCISLRKVAFLFFKQKFRTLTILYWLIILIF